MDDVEASGDVKRLRGKDLICTHTRYVFVFHKIAVLKSEPQVGNTVQCRLHPM